MSDNTILVNAIEQNNFDEANKYFCDFFDRTNVNFIKSQFDIILEELEKDRTRFAYYVEKKLSEKSTDFLFGRFIGFSEAFQKIVYIEEKKKRITDSININDISEIPHVYDIIVTIQQNEGIRHGILAHKVGIEKSTLSGIMERLIEKGAVRFVRPGKFKYYYLTEYGKRFYEENKNVINANKNLDSIVEQLLIALSKEDDIHGKILDIIRTIADESGKYKPYKAHNKEKMNPARIFAGIPSIFNQRVLIPGFYILTIDNAVVLPISQNRKYSGLVCFQTSEQNNLEEYMTLSNEWN